MAHDQAPTEGNRTAGDLLVNAAAFRWHLRSENVSPNTVTAYLGAVETLAMFLAETGRPLEVARITRRDIEAFVSHLLDTRKPATAHQRFRGCQRFAGSRSSHGSRSATWRALWSGL